MEDNIMKEFGDGIFFKSVMARCYGYSPSAFWRLVHANLDCLAQLEKVGYNRRKRTLSPREFRIVCQYYGYPLTAQEIKDND